MALSCEDPDFILLVIEEGGLENSYLDIEGEVLEMVQCLLRVVEAKAHASEKLTEFCRLDA